MFQTLKAIKNEHVVNVKELQKSPSRHLKDITRILRGKKTLGYFLNHEAFDDLLEDLEALSSVKFRESLRRSRASKKTYTLAQIKKRYGMAD